jgi:hypothetical protein
MSAVKLLRRAYFAFAHGVGENAPDPIAVWRPGQAVDDFIDEIVLEGLTTLYIDASESKMAEALLAIAGRTLRLGVAAIIAFLLEANSVPTIVIADAAIESEPQRSGISSRVERHQVQRERRPRDALGRQREEHPRWEMPPILSGWHARVEHTDESALLAIRTLEGEMNAIPAAPSGTGANA